MLGEAGETLGQISAKQATVQDRPYSLGERSLLVATRLLTTVAITGFAGAVLNGLYERFFDPDAYSAGPPLGRGLFVFISTVPFLLAAMLFVGMPASYLLCRLGWENWLAYWLVGSILGVAFLYALFPSLTPYGIYQGAIYGSLCATIWFALRRIYQ